MATPEAHASERAQVHCLHCSCEMTFTGDVMSTISRHVDEQHLPIAHAWLEGRDYQLVMPAPTSELDDPGLTTTLTIEGDLGKPEAGNDYYILVVPADVVQQRPLTPVGPQGSHAIALVTSQLVAESGMTLRQAAWWVTRSPAVLEQRAHPGHCATCASGTARALALMRQDPELVVAVCRMSYARA